MNNPPKTINPLHALVQSAQQESNDIHALTELLYTALVLMDDCASLSEAAQQLFGKVQTHHADCVSHEQAITELYRLAHGIARRLYKVADCYKQYSTSQRAL